MPGQALTPLSAFAFGKLPTHGDFVARGLSGRGRDAWDAWASAGLEEARTALGEAFEARHDTAPPVRFSFGPGPFGEGWQVGAFAPSVDSIGRRFIILLGTRARLAPTTETIDRLASAAEAEIYHAFEAASDINAMMVSAQNIFQTLGSESDSEADGRFWAPDTPLDITASQPPADLIIRVLTT
jgi:type VI secretion system ImpM family protein